MRTLLVVLLHTVVAVLVVGPAFRSPPRDDFPLSNYPMFSEKKDPRVTIQQVVARGEGAAEIVLGPAFVANEEVMQAAATIRRAMGAGAAGLETLCTDIAARVSASRDSELAAVREVLILSRQFHAVKYFSGDTIPEHEESLVRCEVLR